MSYVRHNKLTFYALRRTVSHFSASNFHDCVSKVIVVSKKVHFYIVAIPACHSIAYSSKRRFPLNKQTIYRSYYVDFEGVFAFFILVEVILRDPNKTTISDTKMHLM